VVFFEGVCKNTQTERTGILDAGVRANYLEVRRISVFAFSGATRFLIQRTDCNSPDQEMNPEDEPVHIVHKII
jgi:hypothetical protein